MVFNWKILIFFGLAFIFFTGFATAQNGWTSSKAETGGDLISVFFTSAENGWIAGDAGYLAFTNDGGRNWAKYEIDTEDNINEIFFRNNENGYIVAGEKIFETKNGGRNWNEIKIYDPADFKKGRPDFLSIRFTDKKRGFVVGAVLNAQAKVIDSLVMQTTNGGETWSRIIVPSKAELFHLDFNGTSHGWIVGDKGLILATTDNGFSWQVQASGTDRALYNVDFRDDREGFAVGGFGTILRTENGGRNWIKVTTSFPETFLRVDFADDKNGWIVGYNGSIMRSSDRGKTWVKQNSSTKKHLYGLFMSKKYGFAVGQDGMVLNIRK